MGKRPLKKPAKIWVHRPPRPLKPKVPDAVKYEVETMAVELIESYFKPNYIHASPADSILNYIVDIYARWHRNCFYFCSKYRCPGPNAIEPFFETKFARMEYLANGSFNLAYMRYTEKWWGLGSGMSLNECLDAIGKDPWFQP